MTYLTAILEQSFHLLKESAVYVLFGVLIGGLLRVFLTAATVARHLGKGRFLSVLKAALMGVPLPLCSCGVLPAAAALKRQGASNGATTAFLISTPESGVDSMAITYALLGPVLTVARPMAAMLTAFSAGVLENLFGKKKEGSTAAKPDLSCPVDGCCSGEGCPTEEHRRHHSFKEKLTAGFGYAFGELWTDLAPLFFVGILAGGLITALVPKEFLTRYMGGGIIAMLMMLVAGIPMYICATSSTPIAAALILSGVSPGAALVFLLAGPATNITSLVVLTGILGRRATIIYLATISAAAVGFGLALDWIYASLGLSASAMAGSAAEIVPSWIKLAGAFVLVAISVKPLFLSIRRLFRPGRAKEDLAAQGGCCGHGAGSVSCTCSFGSEGSSASHDRSPEEQGSKDESLIRAKPR